MTEFVYDLMRETFWNDIDHTSWFDSISLFVDEKLAKQCAQEIFERENKSGAFEVLQWFDEHSDYLPNRHWIETRLTFDEYKVEFGNFRIEKRIVHGY